MKRAQRVGPRCVHCGEKVYLTASDGYWVHQTGDQRRCATGDNTAWPDSRR